MSFLCWMCPGTALELSQAGGTTYMWLYVTVAHRIMLVHAYLFEYYLEVSCCEIN